MSQFKGSPYLRSESVIEDTSKGTVYKIEYFSRSINQKCDKCLKRFETALFHEGKARSVCVDCIISDRVTDEEFIDLLESELEDDDG